MSALVGLVLAATTVSTGEWRVTTTLTVAATPSVSMPPDTIVRIVETKTSQLVDFVRMVFLDPDCKLTRYDDSGFVLDARQICNSRAFGRTEWALQGSYSPFRIDARVIVRGKRDGKPVVVTKIIVAELLAGGPVYPDRSVSRREIEVQGSEWTRVGTDEQVKIDVTSDDRCPQGLTCEWSGMVRAHISYRGARGFSRDADIGFPPHPDGGALDAICAWTSRIQVVDVMPKPVKGVAIKPQDYRFRLILGQCGDQTE